MHCSSLDRVIIHDMKYTSGTNHTEARSQNITTEDMAINSHVTKASTMEISYLLHANWGNVRQKSTSLANRTVTPAEEHAAASDRVAVTWNRLKRSASVPTKREEYNQI